MEYMSDAQLLAHFEKTCDLRHINTLVRRHVGRIRGVIFAMVQDDADADDLTQEVFLKAVNKLDGYDKRSKFSTWLYRIAMNTTKDFLRCKKRTTPTCNPAHVPLFQGRPLSAVDSLITKEVISDIDVAIGTLSPKLRSAIVLTAIEGLSVREAARVEKCLSSTMYWRVHQARKLLRGSLAKHLNSTHGG